MIKIYILDKTNFYAYRSSYSYKKKQFLILKNNHLLNML